MGLNKKRKYQISCIIIYSLENYVYHKVNKKS